MSATTYTKELLEPIVKQAKSYSECLRILGLSTNGNHPRRIKYFIKKYELNTNHFVKSEFKIGGKSYKKTPEQILVYTPSLHIRIPAQKLKRALLESNIKYQCTKCDNNGQWLQNDLPLHINHINGNWRDNRVENLEFICPNCHAQFHYLNKDSSKKHRLRIDQKCNKCLHCKKYIWRGCKLCTTCNNRINGKLRRKTNWPTKDELTDLIKQYNLQEIAKQYNVTRAAIVKWCKHYQLPYKTKDIKRILK
jgi:hypothetical protein